MEDLRTHYPGGEWLYLKIYAGYNTLEKILIGKLWPLASDMTDEGVAKLWFFVRYADPDHHLRYRIRLNDSSTGEDMLKSIHASLEPLKGHGLIWKVELGTYRREMERYGHMTIEHAEQLFFHDSRACLAFLLDEPQVGRQNYRWLFAIASADAYLSDFGYNLAARKEIMLRLNRGYGAEFGKDFRLAGQISERYRIHRMKIQEALERKPSDPIAGILLRRSKENIVLTKSIKAFHSGSKGDARMDDLVCSIIHMSMNRIFPINNRLHEMVIYDLLFRHYKSALARSGNI